MTFETPVYPPQNAFSRGEVNPRLFGRVDLASWEQSLRTLRNFTVSTEGAVCNRPGFGYLAASITTNPKGSVLIPFIFSATQSYVLEVGNGTAQVFSAGALVVGATFAIPWANADLAQLRWAQSTDTLTVVHPKYPPQEIKRTSANSFTIAPAAYINGPFLPQNTDGVTFIFASAASGVVNLTANAPIFNVNQVGGYLQLVQQDLSNIQPWEPTKQFPGSTILGTYRRANNKNYKAVSLVTAPAAQNATGTFIPSHSQGTQADGDGNTIVSIGPAGVNWQYQDSGFGVVLITAFIDSTHVTGVVQPNYTGGPSLLPLSVVGGPVVVVGPFLFTGNGVTTSFALGATTTADPSKYYVTINGVYVSPSSYTITAPAGNIVFLSPPAAGGANNVSVAQISQLGQTSFYAFGAFSKDQGYPSAVSYFPDRLILASTPQQPVGVWGSKTSLYHDFGVSNPIIASDAFSAFLNARQLNAINDLIPLSDLLIGTSNITWRLWPGSTGTAISPLALAANPQSYYGQSPFCASVLFGDSAIYPEYDGRRLRDAVYQFAYDKFLGQELTLYSRHLIPKGKSFTRLSYKPDTLGQLVVGLRNDGLILVCTYLRDQQVIGWARWDTQGTFEDQLVVPENNGFAVYAITNRIVNGNTARFIERLVDREVTSIYDYNFLDCSLTYDGRNNTPQIQMTLTGLNGLTAGSGGTLTANQTAGWATFLTSDVTNSNEIWLFMPLTFLNSVAGQVNGVLAAACVAGTYIATFSNGEARSITVAADGVSVSWENALATGTILTCQVRARCLIVAWNTSVQVQILLRDPLPQGLNSVPTSSWTFARRVFAGANQIAGLAAVAFTDALVYGMDATGYYPNGKLQIAADGSFSLPYAGGVVTVGLPYLCDFETLPLNLQGQATIRNRSKAEPVIYLDVTECRNFLAGTSFAKATQMPLVQRQFEPYVSPIAMGEGVESVKVPSTLDSECHTCIRQNMPLPITIRSHIPAVGVGGYTG